MVPMKQLVQSMMNGEMALEEVPVPSTNSKSVLIRTEYSLVSLGTERMLVEFANSNLFVKARNQPDKVRQILDKIRSDGLAPTIEVVFNKLNNTASLGYCNVGVVETVGREVASFKVGDRVVSNGAHAEFVCVSEKLCAKVPASVSGENAVFTVVGAIALQGIRLVAPTLGETVIVVGLGLVGLIAVQLLKANGCNVIGIDTDPSKVKLAETLGVSAVCISDEIDPVAFVTDRTNGVGADAVLIAATTNSNEVISQAAKMSRRRGRIVLVGVVGLDLSRADFYEKELTFQVSCSYGPGRYDDDYELKSRDYPVGFVRWTEQRNLEAVLEVISRGQLDLQSLVTAVTPIARYQDVYDNISDPSKIASILAYSSDAKAIESKSVAVKSRKKAKVAKPVVAVIGAGNYTTSTIIPVLKSLDVGIKTIVSAGGLSAMMAAKKAGAVIASTDFKGVLKDKEVDVVIIATRHNLHADMVIQCLDAGKHVFVEKPLCLTTNELSNIFSAYQVNETSTLTVGFNRRFAPFAMEMRERIGCSQANIVITINAGSIPPGSWVHDSEIGGGRIIGEGCHFIDLCGYLAGSKVIVVCMSSMGVDTDRTSDNASILLNLENGSQATINYFSNGHRGYTKERIEVYSGGRTMVMDNWRTLRGFGFDRRLKRSTRQNKGHRSQFGSLIENLAKGDDPLIPFNEIYNVSEASIACLQSLSERRWVDLTPLT